MDLKTLSGILITRGHAEGRVVIDFARNTIVAGDLEPSDLKRARRIAPDRMRDSYFDEEPCRTVSLREIQVRTVDRDDPLSRPPREDVDRFQINSSANTTRLTIDWKATSGSQIEEISYLAIGPVSLPPPGPD